MFKDLHRKNHPLVICNVWDVSSALIAKQKGFEAIGTSSAAIAKMLGKEDGENVSFGELVLIVTAISEQSSLPLTVDIESGYGSSPEVIAKNISELAKVGVVGINIEDSKVAYGERLLCDEIEFANKLASIKVLLNKMNISVFINVRTDAYLLNVDNALEESIKRIEMYQSAGADGIFLPCIKTPDDISAVVTNTELPINVMCVPDLPDFNILEELGVKRISMGNFLHEAMMDYFSSMLSTIVSEKSFETLFR